MFNHSFEEIVAYWNPKKVAEWLRLNTTLNETQICTFIDSNFWGVDALNPAISSIELLRKRVPTASLEEWEAIIKLRTGIFR